MSIVATEIESIHGATTGTHLVFYRCQDHTGAWHPYGPVHAAPGFDSEAHKVAVSAKVAFLLAKHEFENAVTHG